MKILLLKQHVKKQQTSPLAEQHPNVIFLMLFQQGLVLRDRTPARLVLQPNPTWWSIDSCDSIDGMELEAALVSF